VKGNDRRRIGVAITFAVLAHFTALVLLLPIYAVIRAIRALTREEHEGLWIALLLAVLLHLTLLVPMVHWILDSLPEPGEKGMLNVELWPDADELAKLAPEKEITPEEELEDYEPEEEIPEGQVVQAPPSEDKRPPKEKPKFLAEQDARVEQETKSRIRLPGTAEASARPEIVGKGADPQTMPGGMQAEEHGVAPLPSDLEQADDADNSIEKKAPPSLQDINLQPSMQAMASALAGTGLDHLEDVIEADHTALNTAGWQFAAFFNRVKRQVEQYWHPDVKYRLNDPYGNIYGFKDRLSVLLVVLRGDGSLKKIYIMEPSGASFLDEEAVQAVTQAAPFPNVPEGLKDKRDGLVKFTFHFIVEVGGSPVFRMRRYR
jgi:TonB family protein